MRPQQATQPSLRLFVPRDEVEHKNPSDQWSLAAFYWQWVRPVHLMAAAARPRTLEAYDTSLGYWQRFVGELPLAKIDSHSCATFVARLAELPGRQAPAMAANTIRKHATQVQAILDLAGPPDRRDPHRRHALGLLRAVPYVTRPAAQQKPPEDSFSISELELLIQNCSAATAPRHLPVTAALFWRSLLTVAYNTGLRIDSLLRLQWAWLWPDCSGLTLPPAAAKQGRGAIVRINAPARTAIEAMTPCRPCSPQILPWPNWPESKSWLYSQLRKITAVLPSERRFAFHGLRKAHATELAKINPMAAQMSCNHALASTTQRHYVRGELLAVTLAALPQPQLDRS